MGENGGGCVEEGGRREVRCGAVVLVWVVKVVWVVWVRVWVGGSVGVGGGWGLGELSRCGVWCSVGRIRSCVRMTVCACCVRDAGDVDGVNWPDFWCPVLCVRVLLRLLIHFSLNARVDGTHSRLFVR